MRFIEILGARKTGSDEWKNPRGQLEQNGEFWSVREEGFLVIYKGKPYKAEPE